MVLNYIHVGCLWILSLAPAIQKLDSAIHRINCYPLDKYSYLLLLFYFSCTVSTFRKIINQQKKNLLLLIVILSDLFDLPKFCLFLLLLGTLAKSLWIGIKIVWKHHKLGIERCTKSREVPERSRHDYVCPFGTNNQPGYPVVLGWLGGFHWCSFLFHFNGRSSGNGKKGCQS